MAAFLTPYRAAGYVTDSTPAVVHRQGSETFAVTSVGRSFQVYNCANLRLRFVGPQLPGRIRALQVHGDLTFAAVGGEIHVVQRAEALGVLRGHTRPVRHLVWLGELLVSVCAGRRLNCWLVLGKGADLDEPALTLQLPAELTPSALLHPATYLNKLLVGCASGALELWNVRSGRRIYHFAGWGSAVRALAQSTAVDVVAIGLEDGRIHVHNIREDATLLSFTMDGGSIRALAFRTDGLPILASTSDRGHVALWQLEGRKLVSQIEFAHEGEVRAAHFLAGEPMLLTSGADNALKMWLFDQPSGGARLLRSRSGHASAPTRVRFYSDGITAASAGAAGASDLLSAGSDRSFRRTSLWLQQQDSELTQGHMIAQARKLGRNTRPSSLKLSPMTAFDSAALREREWANVVGTHSGSAAASTWQTTRRALGKHALVSPAGERAGDATACCVSRCGNFAFVGHASGQVHKYNLQSGLHRGSFGGADGGSGRAGIGAGARTPVAEGHRGAVRALAIDATQRLLVSAGHDGTVRLWDVHSRELLATMPCGAPAAHLAASIDSALVAVACDDLRVRVFDVRARQLVRQFEGHSRTITDLAFTPDGRQLLTASLDGSLRLIDLPTAKLVAWQTLKMPATSLSWSPRGEFLATTHAGCVAICVWASRALFANTPLECAVVRPVPLEMPAGGLGGGDDDDDDEEEEEGEDGALGEAEAGARGHSAVARSLAAAAQSAEDEAAARDAVRPAAKPRAQLAEGLATLSGVAAARWKALGALDEIQERNKPEKPPEAPADAPFFLATRAGLEPVFEPLASPNGAAAAAEGDGGKEGGNAAPATKRGALPGWDDDADGGEGEGEERRPGKKPKSRLLSSFAHAAAAAPNGSGGSEGGGADDDVPGRGSGNGGGLMDESQLLRHIRKGKQQGSYALVAEFLKGLTPSAADLQLRLLASGSGKGLADAIDYFAAQLSSRADFELTQALLARFLKLHAALIRDDPELRERCAALRAEQRSAWSEVEQLFHEDLALLSFLSHMQS